jgi:hypothetical protein
VLGVKWDYVADLRYVNVKTVVFWDVTAWHMMQEHAVAFFMPDPEYVGHLHTQIFTSSFAVTVIILGEPRALRTLSRVKM